MLKYTTADISSELGVSERTIRRWISDLIDHSGGKYTLSEDVANLLRKKASTDTLADTVRTPADKSEDYEQYDYVEAFTADEYLEFQKRINEYPVLKEYISSLLKEVDFLRFNLSSQMETLKTISEGVNQRNFIEAKEKKLD